MNNSIKTGAALVSALVFSLAVAAASSATGTQDQKHNADTAAQIVTVAAKRMSKEQKAAYDQEQASHGVQTVIISAKRLSPQAKLAYDKANASGFQANIQVNKTLRQTA